MAEHEPRLAVSRTEIFVDVHRLASAIADRRENQIPRPIEEHRQHSGGGLFTLVILERGDGQGLHVISAQALPLGQLTVNGFSELDCRNELSSALIVALSQRLAKRRWINS